MPFPRATDVHTATATSESVSATPHCESIDAAPANTAVRQSSAAGFFEASVYTVSVPHPHLRLRFEAADAVRGFLALRLERLEFAAGFLCDVASVAQEVGEAAC